METSTQRSLTCGKGCILCIESFEQTNQDCYNNGKYTFQDNLASIVDRIGPLFHP